MGEVGDDDEEVGDDEEDDEDDDDGGEGVSEIYHGMMLIWTRTSE